MQLWTCMCSFSFSLSNSTYLGPFVVVLGGMKCRPAAPRNDMAPQTIWLSGVLPLSASSMAMMFDKIQSLSFIKGVSCGIPAGLWDSSPNSLLRRLEPVLELT